MKILSTFSLIFALAFTVLFANDVDTTSTDVVVASSLFEAIHNIDIVSLNVLLAEGAEVDTVDADGNTPLMIAAKIGNPRMMKIILAHEPDVNRKNNQGLTALMIASENGQLHIAEQLMNNGADIAAKNPQGLTAEQIALRNGHPQIRNLIESRPEYTSAR